VSAVDAVEAEVHELVRRPGLDLLEDQRRLVDEAVSNYTERALTSSLPPLTATGPRPARSMTAVAGFGPLQRQLETRRSRRSGPSSD
jgi:pilus assembly protein CpaF